MLIFFLTGLFSHYYIKKTLIKVFDRIKNKAFNFKNKIILNLKMKTNDLNLTNQNLYKTKFSKLNFLLFYEQAEFHIN